MEDGSGAGQVMVAVFWLVIYLFYSWVLSRLGRKFDVGSFVEFLIPFWNVVLLLRCAGMGAIHVSWFFLPVVFAVAAQYGIGTIHLPLSAILAVFVMTAVVWGKVAGRLDYSPILFGLLFILFPFLPPLILAFDQSKPVR